MKILYLHQYFASPESHTGTRSYEFARRLIAHGHEVRVITSAAALPKQFHSTKQRIVEMEVDGIPCVILNVPYSNSMGYAARMRAFLMFAILSAWAVVRYPADLVFATSTPLTIAIPGIIAKLWHRVPLVFEVRDLWPEVPIAIGALRNPIACWLAEGLEWIAYHASNHIIALAPRLAQGVIRRGIRPEMITVINNSCDVALFDVAASRGQTFRADRLHIAPDQPLVVYTGAFGLNNGVEYLVEVAAAMFNIAPQVRFLLVGEGGQKEKVIKHAQTLNILDKNLWIWGAVPKVELPDLLSAATMATSLVLPLPVNSADSANKFFDALAAGKPIAINYGGWQADVLQRSGAGIVLTPEDPVHAAHALAAFLSDPKGLQQAATAARDLGHKEFSRDLMAARFEAVLRQVHERHTWLQGVAILPQSDS